MKYINIKTGEIVEEHIIGCKCKSVYNKNTDYKSILV